LNYVRSKEAKDSVKSMNKNNAHNHKEMMLDFDVLNRDTSSLEEDEEPPPQALTVSAFTTIEPPRLGKLENRNGHGKTILTQTRQWYSFSFLKQEKRQGVPASQRSVAFRVQHFPGVSQEEWDNWRWQFANRITNLREIERFVQLSPDERDALTIGAGSMPFGVTPYYAALLDREDPSHALRRTVIPVKSELVSVPGESVDPLGEDAHSPVPGIVHRYPDRVLFLVTELCSVHCRYCTRSRIVGDSDRHRGFETWKDAIRYIERNTEIRDVLLSGGDPLTLSDERLKYLIGRVRSIPHVEVIRIGTKVPVVMPQRITGRLVRMLHDFHPLWMSIHFTHPEELTPEVAEACTRLADAGLPLGSQTVLLRGINDDPEVMRRLFHGLMRMRVRPYYIYQCDPIVGSSHFRTPAEKGVEIIRALRGHTSGYAVPQYVIDAPGGGGKIPISPDYVVGREGDDLVLRNYEGRLFRYPDPQCEGATT